MSPKVLNISGHPKYKWEHQKVTDVPDDTVESEEEKFLSAMTLASKCLSHVENNGVRKLIIVERGNTGWFYNYVNITNPGEIIEALAPLWHAARTALRVED